MKKLFVGLVGISIASIALSSCDENELNDPAHSAVSVQFVTQQASYTENAGEKIITLSLNKKALREGTLLISFDSSLTKGFKTTPLSKNGLITLDIKKNDVNASFAFTPMDNAITDGNKIIVFTLNSSTDFQTGLQKTLTVTIQDDESPVQTKESYANFIAANPTIKENNTEGYPVQVHLSESQTVNGSIEFASQSGKAVYGTHYLTEPAFTNGKLTILAEPGTNVISFKVFPINNTIITGELEINFTISETFGNIRKGTTLAENFKIADDELENKPKGYEIGGGQWGLKRTIEYDETGRIHKVYIEESFPTPKTRTETYYYNTEGLLERINTYQHIDKIFTWANGKITKEEEVDHGVVNRYADFEYDGYGNIAGVSNYNRQPDGKYLLTTLNVYFYFIDGNVYKTLVYVPVEGSDEPLLISTRTYDNYIESENPFPMVTILPTVKSQSKLHTTYRIEENGKEYRYDLSYEFRADGLVGKRTATGQNTSETAVYYYY